MQTSAPRGAILAITLMVLGLLAATLEMAFAAAEISTRVAQRYGDAAVAAGAAKAGLAQALSTLQATPSWTAGFQNVALSRSGATFSVAFTAGNSTVPPSTNNLLGATSLTGWGGRVVPPGCACLISIGSYRSATARSQMLIQAGQIPPLLYAVAANGGISVWNTQTDSYNSSQGPYSATHQKQGGNLRSNSIVAPAVSAWWLSTIWGSVTYGPGGGTGLLYVDPFSSVKGGASAAATTLTLTAAVPPTGSSQGDQSLSGGVRTLAPGIYGALTASNATVNLSAGSYVFSSINASNMVIHVPNGSAPTYLYCTGGVGMSSTSIASDSSVPARLWLIQVGGGGVTLELSGAASMVVYAPQSPVSMNGDDFYGAVTGASALIWSTSLHYDLALGQVTGPRGGSTILARWGD